MANPGPPPRADIARFLLWPVLVASVLGNAVASLANADTAVNLAFGGVTALTVITLLVLRSRRRE
ncbi:hypothetical protein ACFU7X_11350 [Streptomyces chartreusis]|uniref:hypothetical protein n=1 Tax=Streptomyces chartreusis TaxID=1969 RepID=UPI00368D435D